MLIGVRIMHGEQCVNGGECFGEANRQLGLGGAQECGGEPWAVSVNLEGPEPMQTEFSALLGLPMLMGVRNKWGNCRC